MKRLIILGAGNVGKITYEYAALMKEFKTKWDIAGYLEFEGRNVVEDVSYPRIISTIEEYRPGENDCFISSYANIEDRVKSYNIIKEKGGHFINIIHPSANILRTAQMGEGNIIGAFTTISVNVKIGNNNIIQDHCNIGHDTVIGDNSHIYVGNIISGLNKLNDKVTIFTGATIYPKLSIGESAVIGAGSVVMRKVKAGDVVIGNPAKRVE